MSTGPPPHRSSSSSTSSASQLANQALLSRPTLSHMSKPSFSLRNNNRPSPWDVIDPSTIEIVDLTGTSPHQSTRRRSTPPISERPSKRSKGKDPDVYIFLDDEDEREQETPPSSSNKNIRYKSPSQSGSLSQAKCVICLDSPTDLSATPCGTPPIVWRRLTLGHLFCDFCIRSALKTGHPARARGSGPSSYSGSCPICRRKITTRSLIPLEIKVRTLG